MFKVYKSDVPSVWTNLSRTHFLETWKLKSRGRGTGAVWSPSKTNRKLFWFFHLGTSNCKKNTYVRWISTKKKFSSSRFPSVLSRKTVFNTFSFFFFCYRYRINIGAITQFYTGRQYQDIIQNRNGRFWYFCRMSRLFKIKKLLHDILLPVVRSHSGFLFRSDACFDSITNLYVLYN